MEVTITKDEVVSRNVVAQCNGIHPWLPFLYLDSDYIHYHRSITFLWLWKIIEETG